MRSRGGRGGRGDLVILVVFRRGALDLFNRLGDYYADVEGHGSSNGRGACRSHRSLRLRSIRASGGGARGVGRAMSGGDGHRLRLCGPKET